MPEHASTARRAHFPAAERQHRTAGPYTPVIGVNPGARLYVISGQVALDIEGRVIGTTIEEQARATLVNCRAQLQAAGCELDHVFKATVYLTDLANWAAFNEVYKELMNEPYPARTAVQCGLLPGLLVEVEKWAAKL
jgi:2-iminobutanoate/2-iminopropanoate deaminase